MNLEALGISFERYRWLMLGFLAGVMICLEWFGLFSREYLSFDELAIQEGQWYRLITGHFVHLGLNHLLMNMAGLVLLTLWLARYFGRMELLLILVLYPLGISLAMLMQGSIGNYVGFSGVLYGLFVIGIARDLHLSGLYRFLIITLLSGKVLIGLYGAQDESVRDFIGGDVIELAHFAGIVLSLIHLFLCRTFRTKSSNLS